ncbi:MAG: methyl-accepting chemotaxis protein [Pseudobutyrivibrio sp.]|nr:methyl-accepting chemotaxis protein [Pseudobutyrivibrio sp.]
MKKRKSSLKGLLIGVLGVSMALVGGVTAVISVVNLRAGMEEEVQQGIMAACSSYAEVLIILADSDHTKYDMLEEEMAKKTGYDYTFFIGDTRTRSSIPNVVGTKANDTVIETVIVGQQDYQNSGVMINGEEYYVTYEPLIADDGSTFGMAFVGEQKSDIMTAINSRTWGLVTAAVSVIVVCLLFAIYSVLKLIKAINANVDVVNELANGNLNVEISPALLERTDELGDMSNALNDMAERLRGVIGNARHSSDEVDDSAGYLSDTVRTITATTDNVTNAITQVASGASTQAEALQEVVENVNEINQSIELIQENTKEMTELADSMQDNSKASSESLDKLRSSTRETIASIEGIVELISNTNNAVTTISEAVVIIDSIAAQTNLLSLNASIEAARAGEAGKGFAVVADEIRQLADQSGEAAQNIQEAMKGLASDSNKTMEEAGSVQETIANQRSIIHRTIEQVNSLIESINKSNVITKDIAKNVEKTDKASDAISDSISSLSSISQENAASSEQTKESMQELAETMDVLADKANGLNEIAKGLDREMRFFQ